MNQWINIYVISDCSGIHLSNQEAKAFSQMSQLAWFSVFEPVSAQNLPRFFIRAQYFFLQTAVFASFGAQIVLSVHFMAGTQCDLFYKHSSIDSFTTHMIQLWYQWCIHYCTVQFNKVKDQTCKHSDDAFTDSVKRNNQGSLGKSLSTFFSDLIDRREQGETNTWMCHRVTLLTWITVYISYFP